MLSKNLSNVGVDAADFQRLLARCWAVSLWLVFLNSLDRGQLILANQISTNAGIDPDETR